MILKLIKNLSPKDYVPKDLTVILTLEGTLRAGTSLLYPSITLEIPDMIYNNIGYMDNGDFNEVDGVGYMNDFLEDLLTCNYAYIEDFNRYYYITNIVSDTNKLWTIQLEYDELESFKDNFFKLDAYITRNEFLYNPFVKDDRISYYYDKDVSEIVPTKGSKVNTTFNADMSLINNNYAITVINQYLNLSVDMALPPDNSLPTVSGATTGIQSTCTTFATYNTMILRLAKDLLGAEGDISYILSCIAYPFELKGVGADHTLWLGMEEYKDVYVQDLQHELSQYLVIADFTITGNSYLDYEPYTKYELWLPYLSWISLSADDILNNRIIVYYVVDYRTGKAQVSVYDTTNDKLLFTSNCQLGVAIAFNKTNDEILNNARNSNNIGLGVGLLSSALAVVAGVATYNPVAIAGGAISAGSTIAKYVQNENTMYSKAEGSIGGGYSGLYLPQEVRLRRTRLKPKGYDANYFHLNGRPLNQYTNLENLRGYTEVGEINLENIVNATKPELDKLEATLKNGIVINKE